MDPLAGQSVLLSVMLRLLKINVSLPASGMEASRSVAHIGCELMIILSTVIIFCCSRLISILVFLKVNYEKHN